MKSLTITFSIICIVSIIAASFFMISCNKNNNSDGPEPNNGLMYLKPYSLNLEEISVSQKKLSWKFDYSTINGFFIDRKVGDNEWEKEYLETSADLLFVIDTNVLPDPSIRYQYKVYAFDDYGLSSHVILDSIFTIPSPTQVSISTENEMTNIITWVDVAAGEDGYKIDRKIGDSQWETGFKVLPENTIEYRDELSGKSVKVDYRIYAYYKSAISDKVAVTENLSLIPPSEFNVYFPTLNELKLSWEDNSNSEQGYKIDIKTGNEEWEIAKYIVEENSTSFIIENIHLNKDIEFRLYAYNDLLVSDSIVSDINTNIPSPSSLNTSFTSLTELKLNWTDNAIGEDGYKIDRKIGSASWEIAKYTVDENTTEFNEPEIHLNQNISYRIYSYKTDQNSYKAGTNVETTIPKPSNFNVDFETLTLIELNWTDNSVGEHGFKIDMKTGNDPWEIAKYTTAPNSNSTEITDFLLSEDIRFRVYAYFDIDNSEPAEKSLNTTIPTPFNLNLQLLAPTTVKLTWYDNISGEDGYKIDRKIGSNGTWVTEYAILGANSNTYTDDNNINVGDDVYYRLYAYKGVHNSGWMQKDIQSTICGFPFVDERDGKSYGSIKIGDQCWMSENLNIGTYISAEDYNHMEDNGIIEKYCTRNSSSYCNIYGGLYQWNEMMQYTTEEGAQGICPEGWHIPTKDEWTTLLDHIGSFSGRKLKSTLGWYNNGNGTDSYEFTGKPAGYFIYDEDYGIISTETLKYGVFWSTRNTGSRAVGKEISYDSNDMQNHTYDHRSANSVRCVLDEY